jgi:O-antigen/teichoic acid export membrane protein
LLRRANRAGFASGSLATLLFLLYARFVFAADLWEPALLLAAAILPSAWVSAQDGLFMGVQLHTRIAWVALVEGSVKLAAAASVFAFGGGLAELCAGLTLARLVALVLGQRFAVRAGAERSFGRPVGGALEFTRALLPFAGIWTLSMLYFRQDVLVVSALRSESETGLYGVATTLYALALMAPNSMMAAIYPRLSAAFGTARDAYHEATILSAKLLLVQGVVMALVLIVIGPWIVRLLYGASFLEAVPVLGLLAAILPLHGVNSALGQAMQAAHLQTEMLGFTLGACVVNLALNLALVPTLGILGAAWALLTTSGLAALVLGWIYHRRITPFPLDARSLLVLFTVAAPVVLVLASPERLRLPAAALGLVVLAAGTRGTGLIGVADLARIATGLGIARLQGPRA